MPLNIDLLREVCEISGVPGFEHRIRSLILREIDGLADDIVVDKMGNVIATKKGKSPKKVMLAAHMDEIGFIVRHIDENGFIHFHTLGGFDPKTLTAQRVIIHGREDVLGVMGSKPIHLMDDEEKKKQPKTTDYFVDVGMSKDQAVNLIAVGDPISRERQLVEMGDCVNCKSIDNRVSVFVLIETLKILQNETMPYDVSAVFTVQEEVGLRGAMVAAHGLDPDFGIALDTTIAYDVPNAKPEDYITQLGNGTAIKIMDSSAICDARMIRFMKETADSNGIKWQPEVLTAGGTDTAGMQRMSSTGLIAGAISIPTRHIHQVIEMANREDIEGSIQLLKHCLLNMDNFNWE